MKKYIQIILTAFFVASLFTFCINAQDAKFDSIVSAGIKQIYDIKFPEAETTFKKLIADYPNKPAGKFLGTQHTA